MKEKVEALDGASDGYGVEGRYDGADVLTVQHR